MWLFCRKAYHSADFWGKSAPSRRIHATLPPAGCRQIAVVGAGRLKPPARIKHDPKHGSCLFRQDQAFNNKVRGAISFIRGHRASSPIGLRSFDAVQCLFRPSPR